MKTIAITSGKGGVGKTNISANLAISLCKLGKSTVILDGDIGLANLDVVLGCKVEATLQDVVAGNKEMREILHEGPGGVKFIPGGSGLETLFLLDPVQSDRILSDLMNLAEDTDFLILDTGAGLDGNVLALLSAADEIFVVVTPDPSSLTDGYATAKAVFFRNPEAKVSLIVNQVANESEAKDIHEHLSGVAERFLQVSLGFAGYVRFDTGALDLIRERVPFAMGNPKLPASQDLFRIASQMIGVEVEATPQKANLISRLRSMLPFAARKTA